MIRQADGTGVHRALRKWAAATLLLPLLMAASLTTTAHASPSTVVAAPEDIMPLRADPDGGYTLNLSIDDGTGGSYTYTEAIVPHPLGVPTLPGARAAGLFQHDWLGDHDGVPTGMQTIGVFYDLPNEDEVSADRRLRIPLLLLENATLAPAAAFDFLTGELELGAHALPLLINLVMPDLAQVPSDETGFPPGGPAYANHPTIYAWHARKVTPAGSVWSGFYAARSGYSQPGVAASHRVEFGAAVREDSETRRVAGAYVENRATRTRSGTRMQLESFYVAGATGAAGDVPLVEVRMEEDREGLHYLDHPEEFESDLIVGARVGQTFIPLFGLKTRQQMLYGTDVTNQGQVVEAQETHRATDLGVYAASESTFVPLLGYHYDGERQAQDRWLNAHIDNGGPGDQFSGDWLASVGVYAANTAVWAPLAGAAYDDDFVEHHYTNRSRYSVGFFLLGEYQATVAATYDGALPIVDWAVDFALGGGTRPWEVAVGVLVTGRYLPVAGVQFDRGAPYGDRASQWHVYFGTYIAADYHLFAPLLWAAYDGDQPTGVWAVLVAFKLVFGAGTTEEGEWEITGGVTPAGLFFVPLIEIQYDPSSPAETAVSPWEFYFVAGVHVPNTQGPPGHSYTFVPLVGVTVANREPLFFTAFTHTAKFDIEVALLFPSYTPILCAGLDSGGPVARPCPIA